MVRVICPSNKMKPTRTRGIRKFRLHRGRRGIRMQWRKYRP